MGNEVLSGPRVQAVLNVGNFCDSAHSILSDVEQYVMRVTVSENGTPVVR